MSKGQGLPISFIVLIVLGVAVLIAIILFFLGGMGSSTSSVSNFQCQQMCSVINTLVQAKSICSTQPTDLGKISTIKSFCSGSCDSKVTCALPNINNGCGYDRSTYSKSCLKCPSGNPGIFDTC